MLFKLNIQLFASKKGVGSTKNGRDSESKRLGAKLADGQFCTAGSIIYRQRGTKILPGVNTRRGGDDTIFATIDGIVKFERVGKNKTRASVYMTLILAAIIRSLITRRLLMLRMMPQRFCWETAGACQRPMSFGNSRTNVPGQEFRIPLIVVTFLPE